MDSKWTKEQIFFDEDAKNKEFGTCYIIKKSSLKVKNAKSKMFIFVCFILAFCIGCFIYNISSNLVSMANGKDEDNSAIIQAKDYYAVSMADYSDAVTANKVAEDSKQLGGAGVVYKNQDKFYILANIYDNALDAEKVKDKLSTHNYKQASVLNIQSKAVNYNEQMKKYDINIGECVAFFDNSFWLFKNLSDSYDKNELSFVDVKTKLLSSYNTYSAKVEELKNSCTYIKDESISKLITSEQNILNIMQSSSDVFTKENNFSSNLKYASIQVVLNRISL